MNKSIKLFYAAMLLVAGLGSLTTQAATNLADKPLFSGTSVPGNVALALSVEFPTALGSAYTNAYSPNTIFLGYFDPNKCYVYQTNVDVNRRHFDPVGITATRTCVGQWSGNFLNWALTQTIDPFRYALTGGYRRIDEVGFTLLEKAWASGQGGTVVLKSITGNALVSGATPYNWSSFHLRINGQGNTLVFRGSTDPGTPAISTVYPEVPVNNTTIVRLYTRVRVCKSEALKEDNCTKYPNGDYKPTGLIQKNALKLNFAAFGYLNDSGAFGDNDRNRRIDGGVLRGRMSSLGPMKPVPGAPDVPNANAEWDANTGIFYTNPDPVAAAASGVANSGVINYLNKFGLTSGSYKKYDPVSELYYTTIRYLKNQGNVSSYTSMSEYTAAQKVALIDGFPVITNWDDPIKYSCQANFIIGVGDTNTHVDGNLPGSTTPGVPSGAMPSAVSTDTTVNAREATNRVGALQGLGNIGGYYTGTNNTRLIAGLAYDSHTKDMRPDFEGKQTVSTYWLDVLESGFVANNQYWLATKYGGFDVPAGYEPYTGPTVAIPVGQWDKNADGYPDNYFRANDPGLMIANLNKAFDDILKKISGSSSAFAVPSPIVTDGDMSFATTYTVEGWSGNVVGNRVSVTNGVVSESKVWDAVDKLEAQASGAGWNSGRWIATANCSGGMGGTQTCEGVPFRFNNISEPLKTNLAAGGAEPDEMLDFLRGDRSNAGALGPFRDRTKILGDIVNSKVVPVGKPMAPYTDEFNPGYTAFKAAKVGRVNVAYVGANDGMLHAFRGTPTGTGGNEMFAYVPNAVFAGPSGTPQDNGLAALAKSSYVHHYYVDATPAVVDINFGEGASDWHTTLIGGLGKGGRSYYAIDVTDPGNLSNESNLANAVLWEFTHNKLGFSYGKPLVVKTKKYGWVVILTSGYNNSDGKGYFFIVNPKNGALLEAISTGEGSVANEAGLAHATAFVADARSFVADAVYAGDLQGNVWRLDLTGTGPGPYAAPTKIANFNNQPITTPPVVEVDQSTSKRYVFVGTGKLLADSDVSSTQQQSFYAINDGTLTDFYTTATLPTGVSFPIGRSQLNDNTSGTSGIGINPAKPMGYYIDLGHGANGVGYRVNVEMQSGAGIIAFIANLTGGDACTPSGSNRLYALTYGTGKSVLSNNTNPVKFIVGSSLGTGVLLYKTGGTDGSTSINYNVSDDSGGNTSGKIDSTGAIGFMQLNWRELPTAD